MEAGQITSNQARSCNPQNPSYRQIRVLGNDWPVINAHGNYRYELKQSGDNHGNVQSSQESPE